LEESEKEPEIHVIKVRTNNNYNKNNTKEKGPGVRHRNEWSPEKKIIAWSTGKLNGKLHIASFFHQNSSHQ
jgi:hypothetical protein